MVRELWHLAGPCFSSLGPFLVLVWDLTRLIVVVLGRRWKIGTNRYALLSSNVCGQVRLELGVYCMVQKLGEPGYCKLTFHLLGVASCRDKSLRHLVLSHHGRMCFGGATRHFSARFPVQRILPLVLAVVGVRGTN
jgi:hypothetical protein